MQVVLTCNRSLILSQTPTQKFVEIANVLKTPPFSICFVCFHIAITSFWALITLVVLCIRLWKQEYVFRDKLFHEMNFWFE